MNLPPETIEIIFLNLCPTKTVFPLRRDPRLLMTQVCSQWRAVALAMPSIWANIHIPLNFPPPHDCVRTWISRSANPHYQWSSITQAATTRPPPVYLTSSSPPCSAARPWIFALMNQHSSGCSPFLPAHCAFSRIYRSDLFSADIAEASAQFHMPPCSSTARGSARRPSRS
ncbi:hypothetical protein BD779DRAFT_1551550 [Infundibulicybe gibba]|nr:hypothetical protein BD779DRAFT_1551550 [Infundibulicybe gibba]